MTSRSLSPKRPRPSATFISSKTKGRDQRARKGDRQKGVGHSHYFSWPRGSTGVQRYGCIPRSAANNLGEIPQKLGAPNPLFRRVFFLGRERFGTRPCQSPSHFGIRLYFLRPHFPSPNFRSLFGNLPCPSFPCFFFEKGTENHQKNKDFFTPPNP